jgi:hypothetical protein
MNPSYIHPKGQQTGTPVSKETGKVEIGDGVVISLLPGLYGYTLRITDREAVPAVCDDLHSARYVLKSAK